MERTEILDDYLVALGLAHDAPTLPYLSEIVRRHVATFAFSSVGPRLGDDLPLDLDALFDRIVVRGRGGYCFEQNGLLFEMLTELGYDVHLKLARVIHNRDIHPGLTHRVTLVEIDGHRCIVDVGFGPLGPPHPVAMPADASDGDDPRFRITEKRPGEFHMQSIVGGEHYSLYRFELSPYGQADCELGHFFSHRHPDAVFVNNLVASLIMDDEVRSLRNRDYRIIRPGGDAIVAIDDATHLHSVLANEFGIRVTDDESRRLFAAIP